MRGSAESGNIKSPRAPSPAMCTVLPRLESPTFYNLRPLPENRSQYSHICGRRQNVLWDGVWACRGASRVRIRLSQLRALGRPFSGSRSMSFSSPFPGSLHLNPNIVTMAPGNDLGHKSAEEESHA